MIWHKRRLHSAVPPRIIPYNRVKYDFGQCKIWTSKFCTVQKRFPTCVILFQCSDAFAFFPLYRPIQWRNIWAYSLYPGTYPGNNLIISGLSRNLLFYSPKCSLPLLSLYCIAGLVYARERKHIRFCAPLLLMPAFVPPTVCGFVRSSGYFPGLPAPCSRLFRFASSLVRRCGQPVFYYLVVKEPFLHPFFALCKIWISNFWTSKCPKKRMVNHTIS